MHKWAQRTTTTWLHEVLGIFMLFSGYFIWIWNRGALWKNYTQTIGQLGLPNGQKCGAHALFLSARTGCWTSYSVPSHYLNQCWLIVNSTLQSKSKYNWTTFRKTGDHWRYKRTFLVLNAFILHKYIWNNAKKAELHSYLTDVKLTYTLQIWRRATFW